MTAAVATFVRPVLGFRAWKVTNEGQLLPRAVSALERLDVEPWRVGRNDARCMYEGITRSHHRSPGPDCDCGLHAYHDVSAVRRASRSRDLVAGAIVAWGDVEVHRDGFRAEHAQVVALAMPRAPALATRARAAAARYGVPLVGYDELEGRADDSGASLPATVRPGGRRRSARSSAGQSALQSRERSSSS